MAVNRRPESPTSGPCARFARAALGAAQVLRTFSLNRLAGPGDQSKCPDPNAGPASPPHTWLQQHFTEMTEALAESIALHLDRAPHGAEGDSLLLTRAQVAGALQISPKTVDRWVEAEQLPEPLRIAGAVRWRREDLERWVREQKATR